MTVKELFLSVGFENVLSALRNTHRNDRSIENVAAYKEAFDVICLTEFEGEGGEVTFDVTPKEHWLIPEPYRYLQIMSRATIGKTLLAKR